MNEFRILITLHHQMSPSVVARNAYCLSVKLLLMLVSAFVGYNNKELTLLSYLLRFLEVDDICPMQFKQEGLAVASITRDVGSSRTNRSSDIMHFLPR